jgi:hypothetical protein
MFAILAGSVLFAELVSCCLGEMFAWRRAHRAECHRKVLIQMQRQAAELHLHRLTQEAVQKMITATRECQ